ncbi:MAG: hypothetical protein AAGF74_09420 [Pseudomonadota bacterium]
MKYVKTRETDAGQSFFEEGDQPLGLTEFVPPADPILVSDVLPASGMVFLTLPAGWSGVRHRSPRRQIAAILSGCFRVETSDGQVRDFRVGDIYWMEDTTGEGHISSAVGDEDVRMMVTRLAE